MAGIFYERIKRDWLEVPVQDNYLFRFILQGFMKQDVTLPLWTQPESFSAIKERASDIQFVHQSIVDYLEQSEDSFDAINLSNISEVMTEKESNHLFDLCRAHINPNGHLLVWNNMVDRKPTNNWMLKKEESQKFWENRTGGSLYGFLGVYQPV